ncbi:MAG: mechanosensitive ion channel family protein [Planctomycetes bacterium]|nr:mechanosensitive ion channel family protein [Planctomycetota bacterium]
MALIEWKDLVEYAQKTLFTLGTTPVSMMTLVQVLIVIIVAVVLGRAARMALRMRILARTSMDEGMRYALARIVGYIVLSIALMVGLSSVGIDLSSLTVLVGALGIGIGFGLQGIINNFVSGLVILFERPFQVGHRVEVGDTAGRVVRIAARSTTIVTNDNIALIIPNADFITGKVVNWSFGGDRRVRFSFPVGVSYSSDPRLIERLLLECAAANPDVLANPPPDVLFTRYGDSSIDFDLRVWTETEYERPPVLASSLYFQIWEAFKKHDIEIPFPQRDLHIKEPVRVEMTAK